MKTINEHLIVSDPEVMMGKPVIAGTRITVELILDKLGAGESEKKFLKRIRESQKMAFSQRFLLLHRHLRQIKFIR